MCSLVLTKLSGVFLQLMIEIKGREMVADRRQVLFVKRTSEHEKKKGEQLLGEVWEILSPERRERIRERLRFL